MQAIYGINVLLEKIFAAALWPMRGLDPIWALVAVSALTGLIMVWIFGKTSNQGAIARMKRKILGNLIAVRLFRHDLGVVMRTQGRILRDTLVYMRYSLLPLLVMIVPVVLIMIQLHHHFALAPLEPGEPTVLKAQVADPAMLTEQEIALEVPEGLVVETPPVRAVATGEVAALMRAERPDNYTVKIRLGERVIEKRVRAGGGWGAVASRRIGRNPWSLLLYPGEAPIAADTPVRAVSVAHPPLPLTAFGFGVNWLVAFLVLSIAFGFAFKGPLGIEV